MGASRRVSSVGRARAEDSQQLRGREVRELQASLLLQRRPQPHPEPVAVVVIWSGACSWSAQTCAPPRAKLKEDSDEIALRVERDASGRTRKFVRAMDLWRPPGGGRATLLDDDNDPRQRDAAQGGGGLRDGEGAADCWLFRAPAPTDARRQSDERRAAAAHSGEPRSRR